jgi:hypothetical protein
MTQAQADGLKAAREEAIEMLKAHVQGNQAALDKLNADKAALVADPNEEVAEEALALLGL